MIKKHIPVLFVPGSVKYMTADYCCIFNIQNAESIHNKKPKQDMTGNQAKTSKVHLNKKNK